MLLLLHSISTSNFLAIIIRFFIISAIPSCNGLFFSELFGPSLSFLDFLNPLNYLKPVWDNLAQGTCSTIDDLFDTNDQVTCKCTGNFGLFTGFTSQVSCELDRPTCLLSNQFLCGTATYNATSGLFSGISKSLACFDFTTGLTDDIILNVDKLIDIPQLCIDAIPINPLLQFGSCTVTFGGNLCNSCTVCSQTLSFQFDCSNVNINPIDILNLEIAGPKLDNCIGVGSGVEDIIGSLAF